MVAARIGVVPIPVFLLIRWFDSTRQKGRLGQAVIGLISVRGPVGDDPWGWAIGRGTAIADAVIVRPSVIGIEWIHDRSGFPDEIIKGKGYPVIPKPGMVDAPDAVGGSQCVGIGHVGHVEGVQAVHIVKVILRLGQALDRCVRPCGSQFGRPNKLQAVIHFNLVGPPEIIVAVHSRPVKSGLVKDVAGKVAPIGLHVGDDRSGGAGGLHVSQHSPIEDVLVLVEP